MNSPFPHLPAESWELFLRDELAPEAALRIEAHLDACPECSRALEGADSSFLFRRLRLEAAPEGVFDGLWDSIEAEIQGPPSTAAGRAPRPPRLAFFGGAAAAAACLVIVVLLARRSPAPHEGEDKPNRAAVASTTATDPCPTALAASLRLTRDECLALYGNPIAAPEPPAVLISESLDLRGL